MQITHNGKKYKIPASISEITLKQVIDFQSKYGNELEEFQKSIDKDDELENFEISMDIACKSVSFFSGIPLDEIYKTDLNQIASIYFNIISPIFQSQEERELRDCYYFKNDLWTISSPELTYNNSMSFNEMILGKEITNDLQKFAIGRYDALQRLCAIYFRKVDVDDKIEKFDEEWMQEGSERMQMMLDLSMDIVLDVAFFLQSSMSIWIKHSRSLESQKEEKDQI